LSDDGEAITLTGNATTTRTISGSGSLEGSTFAQTPNADMTGMTGTLGSGVTLDSPTGTLANSVTGSPALNLGNATFPAGCIIGTQFKYVHATSANIESSSSGTFTRIVRLSHTITPKKQNSLIRVDIHTPISTGGSTGNAMTNAIMVRNYSANALSSFNYDPTGDTADVVIGNGITDFDDGSTSQVFSGNQASTRVHESHSMSYFDAPNSTSAQTYGFFIKSVDGATIYFGRWNYSASWRSPSIIILTEIAQ
jgi:hypothetical protein